jgi:hypothetical protein
VPPEPVAGCGICYLRRWGVLLDAGFVVVCGGRSSMAMAVLCGRKGITVGVWVDCSMVTCIRFPAATPGLELHHEPRVKSVPPL